MKNSLASTRRRYSLNSTALAVGVLISVSSLVANAADIHWVDGTASYTNAADWSPAVVPGATDNAINDNGSNNAVQINLGDPDWTLTGLRAGNGAGNGAFTQNGQTVTVNGSIRPFRIGAASGNTGVYTLNGGAVIFTNGEFVVGQLGIAILNVNGGTINGFANFAVNIGTSLDGVTATMDGGTNKTGFTWFEQGFYTPDTTRGLPAAGSTFSSVSDATHSYTMASSYAGSGTVMLSAGVPSATITLTSPTACSGLSFLGSAGNGPVSVNYTVHHADSTIEVGSIAVLDWFAANPPAWLVGGRVPANGLGFQIISGPNFPAIFSHDIALTNTTSAVTSIDLAYVSGGVAGLMALSGSTGGNFNPLAITGYNSDLILEAAAPIYVSNTVTDTLNQVGGTITNTGEFWVGNYGTGIYNLSGGTNSIANWIAVGRSGGNGTLNMTGGVLNKSGNGNLLVGTGFQAPAGGSAVGILNQSGGTINCLNQFLIPENSPADGTYNVSGTAVLNVNDWIAIGRNGGNGTLNLTNGAIIHTGGGNFDIGGGGPGILNQYGGAITNLSGQAWVGETASATWNLNGGIANVGTVHISQTASGSGTLNVNGGILMGTEVTSGTALAVSTLTLNGGTLQATADSPTFLHDITIVSVSSGGAVFDSQGFNVTVAQAMPNNGGDNSGGLTKLGLGTLTLSGANSYTGPNLVSAGTLVVDTTSAASGSYTVSDGASLSLGVKSANAELNMASLTLAGSTAATLNVDLGSFGNPTLAPLNAAGALTVNGTITINLTDGTPQLGQFPLIKYGSMSGSGSFVLGSLPIGCTASISNNVANSSIDLVFTTVNAPRWEGQAGGNWDIGLTTNWINIGNGQPTFYTEGSPVVFDDNATGTTTVNLVATVHPSQVTPNNNSLNYALVGPGKISGAIGLNKQGSGTFSVLNTGGNDYTKPTVITAGTLNVTNLANGGSPSPIGASSADPTNLVFNGGTLSYSGSPVSVNRGYLVQTTPSAIDTENNLTLSGVAVGGTGTFTKTGPGQLAYTAVTSSNALCSPTVAGSTYLINAGTVVFDGSAGNQTNYCRNLNVGNSAGVDAAIILTNTTLITRTLQLGNNANCTGSLVLSGNSLMTLAANNFAVGISPAVGSPSFGVFTQNPGTTLDTLAELWVGQGGGTGTYNMNGGVATLRTWVAIGRQGGTGTFNMTGGTINKGVANNFIVGTAAGNNGLATFGTLNQSGGTINCTNEYWIAENFLDVATNNISGTAVVNWFNWVSIGRRGHGVLNFSGGTINRSGAGSAIVIGDRLDAAFPGNGYVNQSGGTLTSQNELWIGQGGGSGGPSVGQYDLSGTGSVTVNNWIAIGRGGATGTLNISGGSLTKTGTAGNHLLVGADNPGPGTINQTGGSITSILSSTMIGNGGTGTWNLNNGSAVLSVLHISENSGVNGTLNLNGGTMTATEVTTGNASGHSTLNFNGGTLAAGNGANANFLHDLSTNNVQAGGAIIDSGTNVVNVSQPLLDGGGGGGLTKLGAGTLRLNGINTYTGTTVVNAGTLGGSGTIAGPLSVPATGTLAPGNSIGTLTVNNSATLGGTIVMELSKNGGVPTNDLLAVSGNLAYGGTLTVVLTGTNILAYNDTFNLFDWGTQSGSFSAINLPAGYYWDTSQLNVNGTIRVLAVSPAKITSSTVSGGNLVLQGAGGPPGASYSWLTHTNVAAPLSTWTTNSTGVFDGNGNFSNAFPTTTVPARFFRLKTP
jgi:autotransporter-associated beta strand protein